MQQSLNKYGEKSQHEGREVTYVFQVHDDAMLKVVDPQIKTGVWQIFPSACASLTCIPFGLMLGWPSPTYPTLIAPSSPVPITLDQSAMVAGFLMLGVSLGTIFSTKYIGNGPKYGIILANVFIMLGWIIMWQAQNVYWLLGSRLVLGIGHGYAMGQIKDYIKEMTEEILSVILIKQVNIYVLVGFLTAFFIGPFIEFRQFSLISLITSVFILFLAIFLPSTPRELIRSKKMKDAKKLLIFLKPDLDTEQEAYKITQELSEVPENNGFTKIVRNEVLRNNLMRLTILLICQQYCGAPSTLVYTQILFTESHVPYPEYTALIYAVLFFASNLIGTYIIPRYNKKIVLLFSSCSVTFLYICNILVIYFKVNDNYFSYSSVIIMYLFIFAHTVGLGSVPFTLINDWFPKTYRVFVTKYFIILFSILALTITKIFQVLMGQFSIYMPFCLFLGITIFSDFFVLIFIPYELLKINENSYNTNVIESIHEDTK